MSILVGILTGIAWPEASFQVQMWWQMREQRAQAGGLGMTSVTEGETLLAYGGLAIHVRLQGHEVL